MEKVPAAGYRIVGLPVSGFDRAHLANNIRVAGRLLKSLKLAKKTIREFKPDIAVGVGGYASGPTLWMAASLGIPTLIQEQNSYAGVTNKLLAKKAGKICVAYEGMEKFFPADRIVVTGGVDANALHRPKRFFGAARNMREGGSLTMIATVLVETGSRMDDIIFEEFKGTGNAEIKLDRALSEARIFPAIDLAKSGTRHEELLLSPEECEGVAMVRRMLGQGHTREATGQLIGMLLKTEKNEDFFKRLKEWLAIWEKEGYTIRSLRSGV